MRHLKGEWIINMKKITDKEYEEFQKYKTDVIKGKILTPDGIRLIIKANDYDPEGIGKDILKAYVKIRNGESTY